MKTAIVLDGHLKSSLSIVRSLGRAGISVSVGATRNTAMTLFSRFVTQKFVYPSPYDNEEGFVETLKAIAGTLGGKPVVYAQSDATYLSLYAKRDVLAEYVTLHFPKQDSIELTFNKAATYSLACVSEVPTIRTYLFETKDEVEHFASTRSYPMVVKPRRSVSWMNGKGIFGTATFVHSKEELIERFLSLKDALHEAPLIQDFMYGEEYGVEMLVKKGLPYALTTHHRIRSLSPTGGASVLKETVAEGNLKNELETYARHLAKKLIWEGPIMFEFKVDSDTQEVRLMEINGRFWGSLPLSIAAGVDIPVLYYEQVTRGVIPSLCVTAQEHIISRHVLGDVKNLLSVMYARDMMRPLLYPRRLQALRNFFSIPRGTVHDVWSWNDPLPAFMEIIDVLKKTLWK
jgi:predicted ATP-grasp superfamily ATP-dependent carboligase